jgi:hypothetical protein
MGRFIDITGQVFTRLTVIEFFEIRNHSAYVHIANHFKVCLFEKLQIGV